MVVLVVELGPIAEGMLGQRGYIHGLGGVTNGAGKELFALFGMGRLYSDNAIIPLVHFLLFGAAGTGAVMVFHIAVALCPGTKGVLRGLFDCLGLGGLADFARIGQNTLRGVGSGSGDHALVPLVGFGDFSVAFFAGLRVVLTVFYGPTSGGEAVAVVVRVQRELESLRGGRDGASCVRKQRAALGADVVRLCTLYRTGRWNLCHKGEGVVALLCENKVFRSNRFGAFLAGTSDLCGKGNYNVAFCIGFINLEGKA